MIRTFFALTLSIVLLRPAWGVLDITVTQGLEGALPVAVVPFLRVGGSAPPPVDLAAVISSDLARSGRFKPYPVQDLPARPGRAEDIRFRDWRLLGSEYLVVGQIEAVGKNSYTTRFRLFDVFKGAQLSGFQFETSAAGLRRTAHQISDIIYRELTGEPGAFNTRIAYVTDLVGGGGKRRYVLNVADSDGHNAFPVLESGEPLMSPSWSPDGSKLAYVSFEHKKPSIFIQDLAQGSRRRLSSFPGINGAPAWSPDGSRMAMTLSKDGNPEIYIFHFGAARWQRLTHNAAIDTEAAWAPDGLSIVFTSDRGGTPQIYRMPISGGRAHRLSFEGRYNTRASFSPDGKRLALLHGDNGNFRIAVFDLETQDLRILTDSRLDESPSFAPNGSMILYATVKGEDTVLGAVSVDGRVRQQLAVEKGGVREPAWSPFQ